MTELTDETKRKLRERGLTPEKVDELLKEGYELRKEVHRRHRQQKLRSARDMNLILR